MFVLRPSSPFKQVEPDDSAEAEKSLNAEPSEKIPFSDPGLPIPDHYDVDIIRAMVQDPFRIYIYWEVRDRSFEALARYFSPEERAAFQTVLRLVEMEGCNEAFFEVAGRGDYWMMVFPDREYEFEIGVRSPVHGYISIVRSNRVRTPRGAVSAEPARESEYSLDAPEFIQVLEAAGFGATQFKDITVSAMPGESDDLATQALFKLPEPVRDAVLRAASGEALTRETISQLPNPLRGELMKFFSANNGRIASAGLMHYLPELLREVLEGSHEWIGDSMHPLRIEPRFFLGGTENIMRSPSNLQWPGLPGAPSSAEMVGLR